MVTSRLFFGTRDKADSGRRKPSRRAKSATEVAICGWVVKRSGMSNTWLFKWVTGFVKGISYTLQFLDSCGKPSVLDNELL